MTEHNTSGGLTALAAVEAERDRLQRWKDEALPVIFGLQDLGKALGLRLGTSITGPDAAEAARDLLARAESAEAENARLRARLEAVEALAEDADPEWHVPYCGSLLDADEFDQHACVPVAEVRAALDSPTSHTQQEAEVVCDHPGIDHSPWSYCGVCPACGVCKFIGHGPLCIDCYATRARTTEEPS